MPDPYYGQHDGFEGVFEILNRSIKGLILALKEKHLILRLSAMDPPSLALSIPQ